MKCWKMINRYWSNYPFSWEYDRWLGLWMKSESKFFVSK